MEIPSSRVARSSKSPFQTFLVMESSLNEIANSRFNFDAMNLDPDPFPEMARMKRNLDCGIGSMFASDISVHCAANALQYHTGDSAPSTGVITPGSLFPTELNEVSLPKVQSSEPIWTPIIPQGPTRLALSALPLGWRPCSPPLLPVVESQLDHSRWIPCSPPHTPKLAQAFPSERLKQFQYPDPETLSASKPVPYLSLPPRSVPAQCNVSPIRSKRRPIKSPTHITSARTLGLKRRRSIHLEDLYTSDQESDSYDSDSNLSSAPLSPCVSSAHILTPYGVKMGPKHKLEQTKERQRKNERRRAYYQRIKQNPSWKAKQNALERSKYHKRQTRLGLHPEVAQTRCLRKAVPEKAKIVLETVTPIPKKPKSKWKGWVVLSDEEEELSEQVVGTTMPDPKKTKLTKEIENTKEFVRPQAQAVGSDGDDHADEGDGEEYRIIPMDQSRRRGSCMETRHRRSRRAKQSISYAEK